MDESKAGEEIMLTEIHRPSRVEKTKKWSRKEGLVSVKGLAPPHYTALKPHPIYNEEQTLRKFNKK